MITYYKENKTILIICINVQKTEIKIVYYDKYKYKTDKKVAKNRIAYII